jgi:protein-L-isoaspartate(D-aspartate) O-methyltransferase
MVTRKDQKNNSCIFLTYFQRFLLKMSQIVVLYKKLLMIYYTMVDFDAMRQNMITNQILTNKVTHSGLIQAISKVKREQFVPPALRATAYAECNLELAPGRFMLSPMVLCRLIQTAEIQAEDSVLVVAAGTGYGCALLGFLCERITGIEEHPQLLADAQQNLLHEGYSNIELHQGPLTEGWAASAPYQLIIVEGSIERAPETLKAQLAEYGGRLLYMQSRGQGVPAQAMKIVRDTTIYTEQPLFEANAPVLNAFNAAKEFKFA